MNHPENGHDAAWLHQVFEKYESRLVVYAARLVGDVERGRDIVQDVFLKLCHGGRVRNDHQLAAWLFTVCRNRALDVSKRESRVNSMPPGMDAAETTDLPDPQESAVQREDESRALTLLRGLPDNQQEVIRLKIESGLKYREISEITGLSVTNVGYLLHQGLQTLRRQLSGQEA